MAITYRNIKGAPLSINELDQNFRNLHKRLESLEKAKELQKHAGIAQISQEDKHIIFKSTANEVIGRLEMPLPHLRARGPWDTNEDYSFYDLCTIAGKIYICKKSHKSSNAFNDDQGKWEIFFAPA